MKEWLASLPPISVSTILLVLLIAVLLGYLGYLAWKSWRRLDELELKDRFAARNNFIKTTAQILGGAFFLFGLYFTWANVVATQEKNVTDLYVKAIEQLGRPELEVRLGGIYALERIARDSQKDHWTIMEVLTAYVREKAPATIASKATLPKEAPMDIRKEIPTQPEEYFSDGKPNPKADIQAALTVLGRTAVLFAQKGEKRRLNLQGTNLDGVELYYANLRGANFTRANLQKAELYGANLQLVILRNANLQEARLDGINLTKAFLVNANLKGAWLVETNLQGVLAGKANFQDAVLAKSDFQGAGLEEANLQGAELREAKLQGAHLWRAKLNGTRFWKAKLQGADLRESQGLTSKQVATAFWDETTKWPEGFTPPAPRREEKIEGK